MAQAIPIALAVGGAALQAGGTIVGANSQATELNSQADQLDTMAGQDRASGQRAAAEQLRQSRLLQSTGQARAAATGGASDPTVVNILANLEGEGKYRALTALYDSEETARSKEMQGIDKRKEAGNVKTAGLLGAVGSLLSSGSSLYSRFGGGSSSPAPKRAGP